MSLSGGHACMKYTLFAINLLFCILGAVLLGLGIWVRVDSTSMEDTFKFIEERTPNRETLDATPAIYQSNVALIVGGAFIFIISFMGCCGAIKEWRILLVIYAFLLSILAILHLAASIAVAVYRQKVLDVIPDAMNYTIRENYWGDGGIPAAHMNNLTLIDLTVGWDFMQEKLMCCGMNKHTDYKDFARNWDGKTNTSVLVPPSCCIPGQTSCPATAVGTNAYIDNGCVDDLQDLVSKYAWVMFGMGIALTVLQLIGVIVACVLCNAIGKQENSV